VDSIYVLSTTAQAYHPLEAVLVDKEVRSGDWKDDVALGPFPKRGHQKRLWID